MPGFNRQGPPNGQGNQSGRRMGKCNPANTQEENSFNQDNSGDRGMGQGRGQGKGFGNGLHNGKEQGRRRR